MRQRRGIDEIHRKGAHGYRLPGGTIDDADGIQIKTGGLRVGIGIIDAVTIAVVRRTIAYHIHQTHVGRIAQTNVRQVIRLPVGLAIFAAQPDEVRRVKGAERIHCGGSQRMVRKSHVVHPIARDLDESAFNKSIGERIFKDHKIRPRTILDEPWKAQGDGASLSQASDMRGIGCRRPQRF